MTCQHRVCGTRQGSVTFYYALAKVFASAVFAQMLELIMGVEDEGGGIEGAGGAAGAWMETYDEEGFASETQRKFRMGHVRTDPGIVGTTGLCVEGLKALKAVPHGRFKLLFRQNLTRVENYNKALEGSGAKR